MNLHLLRAMAAGLAAIALFSQCTKPTIVGADILDQDQSELVRTDTVSFTFRTVSWDSVTTWTTTAGTNLVRYPLGHVVDPLFGISRTTVSFEVLPSYGFSEPDFSDAVPDSIVLTLAIDTNKILGLPDEHVVIDVFRLTERIPNEDLTSRVTLPADPMPLGSYSGRIWPVPLSPAVDYVGTIDTPALPQIRIPLDLALAQEIMALDSATLVTDSLFLSIMKGFSVRLRDPMNAYAGFYIQSAYTALQLYYHVSDTIPKQVKWVPITGVSRGHYAEETDRSSVTYPGLLNASDPADSVFVIQGGRGFDLEVHFPWLDQHERVLVNLATLDMTLCDLSGIPANPFGPPDQLEIYTYEDGRLVLADDVVYALASGTFGLQTYFGGIPVDDGTKTRYRFNLSAQVQKILLGEAEPVIYVRVRQRETYMHRAVICGRNSTDPPKLTLTYTRLNP